MKRGRKMKVLATVCFAALAAVWLLFLLGKLPGPSMAVWVEKYPPLFFGRELAFYAEIVLTALLFVYLLYSWNALVPHKSEYARQYCRIADVGLFLSSLSLGGLFFFQQEGKPLAALGMRLLLLLLLCRTARGYAGNPRRLYWWRTAFDAWLGWTEYLLVADAAAYFLEQGGCTLMEGTQTLILVCVLTGLAIWLGLWLLSPMAIFSVLLILGGLVAGFDQSEPALFITGLLCLAGLLAAFIVSLVQRRRRFWC